ncbi:MAG TPA: cytochrome c [Bacteroidales bacterium]|nr:cytochrome c [Bacteroidales bacterium]
MRSIILFLTILQLAIPALQGQEWIVPDDKKGRLSTFEFDDNTRTAGQKIYTLNCMSCHGTPGKSNYLNLVPPPGDPATEKIQKNNDGELFYKVTTGNGQMPSFKSVLTTDEVWEVISYLRSFNKTYKQQVRAIISSSSYPGATINMSLEHNPSDSTIILTAFADKENTRIPVTDAGVRLYVHRTFGHQAIDEKKVTDKTGRAVFRIPPKMHGDSLGNVAISARFIDEEIFGSASKDTVLTAGIKITPVSLVAKRAMWNIVRKAPIWILLSFVLGIIAAWSFIILVLMKIRDIHIIGKYLESASSEKQE